MSRWKIVVMVGLLGLSTVACGGSESAADDVSRDVLVSAAASLTDVFGEIETAFEAAHPGVDLVLNLAGSSMLREQILEGAPADVFASANMSNMQQLVDAGEVEGEPVIFAENLLQIAVPAGNPAAITGLEDLGREELLVGLCAEGVPCGDFARSILDTAGVTASVDTNEADVRALLTKLELGELDVGITYVTDVVVAAGLVEGIDIPVDVNIAAQYPIAVLANAPNPDAAQAFVDFVISDEGRAILADYGFAVP